MSKNGLILLTPTSVTAAGSGSSATINANGSVSFSTANSISLNGVFSADYDNYRIVVRHTASGGNGTLKFRMRASGTDNTTASSYTTQYLYASTTSVSGFRQATSQGELNRYGNVETGFIVDFYGPYLAQPTALRSVTVSLDNTIDTPVIYDCAATHNQSTAYDGFSFYTGTTLATLTGRVAVYGMRK